MCEPISMAMMASSLLSAGGALMGGAGGLMGGNAKNRAAKIAAQVENDNAQLSLQEGSFNAARIGEQTRRATDAGGAFFAANNLDPTYGTPAFLAAMNEAQGESDRQIALSRGMTGFADHKMKAASLIASGRDAQVAGNLSMATSVLKAASSFLPKSGGGFDFGGKGGVGDPLDIRPQWGVP